MDKILAESVFRCYIKNRKTAAGLPPRPSSGRPSHHTPVAVWAATRDTNDGGGEL